MHKIIIVDYDPTALVQISGFVEKAGFKPLGFQKAGLALEYFLKPESRDVCMVITDAVMPGMDGFSFLKEAKKVAHAQSLPFLFLSEVNDTAVLINAYEHGAIDYFIKPIRKEALFIAKIKSMATAFEKTRASANTLMAGHLEEKPFADILALCDQESLNGFLKISHPKGMIGTITFTKGLPETVAITDLQGKPLESETDAFEKMNEWSEGEFIVRRGNL